MQMKWLAALLLFALGVGVGIWYQKRHTPPPPPPPTPVINLKLDSLGYVDLVPAKGDIIQWTAWDGSKVNPIFTKNGANQLCAEGLTPPANVCTVTNDVVGLYQYDCSAAGCIDPIIGPGSSIGPPIGGPGPKHPVRTPNPPAPQPVNVSCNNDGTVHFDPSPVPPLTLDQRVAWIGGGIVGTVTNLQDQSGKSICKGTSETFDVNGGACEVVAGWTTATYAVSLTSPTACSGTGNFTYVAPTPHNRK
jgi:hypothetical protein